MLKIFATKLEILSRKTKIYFYYYTILKLAMECRNCLRPTSKAALEILSDSVFI